MNSHIEIKRSELRKYANEKKISKCKFPNEKQMALELGKTEAYLNYKLLSQTVHISPLSHRKRTKADKGIQYVFTTKNDISQIYNVAVEALEWFLEGSISCGIIFGWENVHVVEAMGNNGEEIFQNVSSSNSTS